MTEVWFYRAYLPAILMFSVQQANDTIALKQQPPMGNKKKTNHKTKTKNQFIIITAKKTLLWWAKDPIDFLVNKINDDCSEYLFLNTHS